VAKDEEFKDKAVLLPTEHQVAEVAEVATGVAKRVLLILAVAVVVLAELAMEPTLKVLLLLNPAALPLVGIQIIK
jgi:hypothetical protein